MASGEVLRYWLALLRHQEALATRPKARRVDAAPPSELNVREPVPGQDYAKLPYAGLEKFLSDQEGEAAVELTGEWYAFFEHWLSARYRRGEDDEGKLGHLVFFPTLHLARDQLAGLLRCPVELSWSSDKGAFTVPSYANRKRQRFPEPPTMLTLRHPSRESTDTLPFFIDARLLRETLRIEPERIDALYADLKGRESVGPRDTIAAVIRLVEDQGLLEAANGVQPEPDREGAEKVEASQLSGLEPQALLARLHGAVAQRLRELRSRVRSYGIALVVNAETARTSWHLQRDIQAALAMCSIGGLDVHAAPLHSYLFGPLAPTGERSCWGRWRGAALTRSQQQAVEVALGSSLSAVQGPPGTGKTTLILSMAAHTLISKIRAMVAGGSMGAQMLVVVSTNNRAVDNVVDPLGRELDERHLALSLRVGSRQVVEKVTVAQLRRAKRWLDAQKHTEDSARALLTQELSRFQALLGEMESLLAPVEFYRSRVDQLKQRQGELRALDAKPGVECDQGALQAATEELCAADSLPQDEAERQVQNARKVFDELLLDPSRGARAAAALKVLSRRMATLSRLAEGKGDSALVRLRQHFVKTRKSCWKRSEEALGFALFAPLPPCTDAAGLEQSLELWEDGAERCLVAITTLGDALAAAEIRHSRQKRRVSLAREIESLVGQVADTEIVHTDVERGVLASRHQAIFESAVRVREAWARVHSNELGDALRRTIAVAESSRTLRGLMEVAGGTRDWLQQLFPAWGSTLLSLGNVFAPEPGRLDTVVIDEAGQCHPAYAVSALLRARNALVIGDVCQLEPVVDVGEADERRILRSLDLRIGDETIARYRCFDGSAVSAQSVADLAVERRPRLIDHFRCQPAIARISDRLCNYGLLAHTPFRSRVGQAPFLVAPVLHVSVEGFQRRFAGSWVNDAEAEATCAVVSRLLAMGIRADDLGVITPYRGQLERLWRAFREARIPVERPPAEELDSERPTLFDNVDAGLAIGTVHRFQGGERSIVVFSATVSELRSLDFLDRRVNLVNVAASRARDHLITIGRTELLQRGRHTKQLLTEAHSVVL